VRLTERDKVCLQFVVEQGFATIEQLWQVAWGTQKNVSYTYNRIIELERGGYLRSVKVSGTTFKIVSATTSANRKFSYMKELIFSTKSIPCADRYNIYLRYFTTDNQEASIQIKPNQKYTWNASQFYGLKWFTKGEHYNGIRDWDLGGDSWTRFDHFSIFESLISFESNEYKLKRNDFSIIHGGFFGPSIESKKGHDKAHIKGLSIDLQFVKKQNGTAVDPIKGIKDKAYAESVISLASSGIVQNAQTIYQLLLSMGNSLPESKLKSELDWTNYLANTTCFANGQLAAEVVWSDSEHKDHIHIDLHQKAKSAYSETQRPKEVYFEYLEPGKFKLIGAEEDITYRISAKEASSTEFHEVGLSAGHIANHSSGNIDYSKITFSGDTLTIPEYDGERKSFAIKVLAIKKTSKTEKSYSCRESEGRIKYAPESLDCRKGNCETTIFKSGLSCFDLTGTWGGEKTTYDANNEFKFRFESKVVLSKISRDKFSGVYNGSLVATNKSDFDVMGTVRLEMFEQNTYGDFFIDIISNTRPEFCLRYVNNDCYQNEYGGLFVYDILNTDTGEHYLDGAFI
jgi:hypothetical protein